jgi:hypothetical protein
MLSLRPRRVRRTNIAGANVKVIPSAARGGNGIATVSGRVVLGAVLLGAALALTSGTADAIDPSGARYLPEADELFWFVQISDTHVGAGIGYGTQDTDHLRWVVSEGFDVIAPEFVVLTGDIVDGTNGLFVPTGQFQSEWDEYRDVVDDEGMDVTLLHDIVGNHDTYSDKGATHYLANSLIGTTYGALHESWRASFDWGEYLFVGICTADLDGSFPGLDSPGASEAELAFLDDELAAGDDARLAFFFSHHPLHSLDYGADDLQATLAAHRVSLWSNGHDHDHFVETWGETVHFNLNTAGKGSEDNLAVVAVDHDGVAVKAGDVESWPFVLITAPNDLDLGDGNPHAYPVSAAQGDAFVRAVVFDADPDVLAWLSIDGGAPQEMEQVAPSTWQASFDAALLGVGVHEATVEAESPSGSDSHSVRFELATTECDDGLDNDGNGFVDHAQDGGCWGPSDDDESGWTPGDDDDSAGDDDDSASDDDDATGDDDDAVGDDDDAGPGALDGDGCGCAQADGAGGRFGWLLLLPLLRRRRRGASD